jgi:hypothetical protein
MCALFSIPWNWVELIAQFFLHPNPIILFLWRQGLLQRQAGVLACKWFGAEILLKAMGSDCLFSLRLLGGWNFKGSWYHKKREQNGKWSPDCHSVSICTLMDLKADLIM